MAEDTISYSELSKGFPSRYTFYPESIVALGSSMYTFKRGDLWIHNENELRNNFYGTQYSSKIVTVINKSPGENKLFKTIALDGSHPWSFQGETELQASGSIDADWFEPKAGGWFAYIRNIGQIPITSEELRNRSVNGIGRSVSVSAAVNISTATFSISPLIRISEILSVGDLIYFSLPPYATPLLAGKVTEVNIDLMNGINNIKFDTTFDPSTSPITIQDAYFMFVKNSVAESHGLLGSYTKVTLENTVSEAVELFFLETEVMKSFP